MIDQRKVEKLQSEFFGTRYVGATLSKVMLPEEYTKTLIDWKSDPSKILLLYGPPGVGKTYICSAFLEWRPANCFTFRAYNERSILERLRGVIGQNQGDYMQYLHELIDDDFIIIDDLGSAGANDWRKESVMEIVDYRYNRRLPTIITSNLDKQEFERQYGFRVASRLFAKENAIINLDGMDDQRALGN